MTLKQNTELWALASAERSALADDLATLSEEQWRMETLCAAWDVEDVVAHLISAASMNQWQWLRSMVGARFRPDVHNQRRLTEYRGASPAETLERFLAVVDSTTAPSGHIPAYLGEIVVHAQDVRRPAGMRNVPCVESLTPVAEFFARRDFAVDSRTHAAGLHLRSDDGPFEAGSGPEITGSTLALVMSMAGRTAYLEELEGAGVQVLGQRLREVADA